MKEANLHFYYSKTSLKLNSKNYDYFIQLPNLYNFSSLILNRFEYKTTLKLNLKVIAIYSKSKFI